MTQVELPLLLILVGGQLTTQDNRGCNTSQRTSNDDYCKIKRLGNVYGEQFGTSYGGNVWDIFSISPVLKTGASASQQCVIEIKRIGKYDYRKIKPKK